MNVSLLVPKQSFKEKQLLSSTASRGRPAATFPTRGMPDSGKFWLMYVPGEEVFLSSFCALEVTIKERALPGQAVSNSFFRSSAMCSNAVLRLMFSWSASSDIVGE